MTTLYNLKSADGSYRITKFDTDMNPEGSYLVSPSTCECPAGVRPTCRHRKMLPRMIDMGLCDSPDFYNFDTGQATTSTIETQLDKAMGADVDSWLTLEKAFSQPHSTTVSATDFDSVNGGSNPPAVANHQPFKRRF